MTNAEKMKAVIERATEKAKQTPEWLRRLDQAPPSASMDTLHSVRPTAPSRKK